MAKNRSGSYTPNALPFLAPGAAYPALLDDIKTRIRTAQLKASIAVNRELILLYWQIGRTIQQQQLRHGWGAKVIDRLAGDCTGPFRMSRAFPFAI